MVISFFKPYFAQTTKDCEKMIRGVGTESIVQQMMQVDVLALPESALTRAKQLLEGTNQSALREENPLVGVVCDWVNAPYSFLFHHHISSYRYQMVIAIDQLVLCDRDFLCFVIIIIVIVIY